MSPMGIHVTGAKEENVKAVSDDQLPELLNICPHCKRRVFIKLCKEYVSFIPTGYLRYSCPICNKEISVSFNK